MLATATSLRKLSPAEHSTFDDQGFVVVPDVFQRHELEAIDAEIDRILQRDCDHEVGKGDALLRLGLRSGLMQRICADPRLLALVEDLVKPGIAIYSAKMVHKTPGQSTVCHWHQDDAYYTKFSQSRTRMSIWLALHDSDAGNGGVWFLPGSHRRGLREHRMKDGGMCRLSFDPRPEELAGAVCPSVRAGAVALFSALTWHHSGENRSDRTRRAFIVSYQEATVVGGNKDQWKILRPAESAV